MGRYVALYRASGDSTALGRTIGAIVVWQLALTCLLIVIILLGLVALPNILGEALRSETETIQWVTGLLAAGLTMQLAMGPARGILSGHHRWVINNAVNAASDIGTTIGIVIVLFSGGGLVEMAATFFVVTLVTESVRGVAALALVSDVSVDVSTVDWKTSKKLIAFGAKSSIMVLPSLFITQTTSVLLANAAGPASLAIFARPMSLLSNIRALVGKYSLALTPMTGSLIGVGKSKELPKFFLQSIKTALLIAGPMLAVLAIDGDIILRLWMGEEYASQFISVTLALGAVLPVAMSAAAMILAGLNLHGKVSVITLAVSVLAYVITWHFLIGGRGLTPESAAIVVAVCSTMGPGLTIFLFACKRLSVPVVTVLRDAFLGPISLIVVFGFLLSGPRALGILSPVVGGIVGFIAAAFLYTFVVWRFFLNRRQRLLVKGRVRALFPVRVGNTRIK
jgi:O-antigen/teichoic acid export membrane protein